MKQVIDSKQRENTNPPTSTPAPSNEKKLGSVEIQIKEVDVSRPARSVNRMWPNR